MPLKQCRLAICRKASYLVLYKHEMVTLTCYWQVSVKVMFLTQNIYILCYATYVYKNDQNVYVSKISIIPGGTIKTSGTSARHYAIE